MLARLAGWIACGALASCSSHAGGSDASAAQPAYDGGIAFDGCAATGTCAPDLPIVLAAGQATPAAIVLDAENVYWIDLGWAASDGGARPGGQIMKCAKSGCGGAPTVLASGEWIGASKLGVDGTNVYWLTSGSVLACPLAGCTGAPRVVWSGDGPTHDIAVDSTGVFVATSAAGGGQVIECPGGSCDDGGILWPAADAAMGGTPVALAIDATRVYFVAELALMGGPGALGGLLACDKQGCPTNMLLGIVTGAVPSAQLVVDGVNAYTTSPLMSEILSAAKSGSQVSTSVLVMNLFAPAALATDGTWVYYTDTGQADAGAGAGRVAACAAAGCGGKGRPIAGYVNHPLGVAVDSTTVYWTDFGASDDPLQSDAGRVMAVRKPGGP